MNEDSLLFELDRYARDIDYEYGLPLGDIHIEIMEDMVREWLLDHEIEILQFFSNKKGA